MTCFAPAVGASRGLGRRRVSPCETNGIRRGRRRAAAHPVIASLAALVALACNSPVSSQTQPSADAAAPAGRPRAQDNHRSTCVAQVDDTTPTSLRPIATAFCSEAASLATTGAALSVQTPGGESLHITYGRRCRGRAEGVDRRTMFRWGSISKVVTSLAVLSTLNSRGGSPAATIGAWFPELESSWAAKLPVRSLLTHTSGLAAFDEDGTVASLDEFFSWVRDQAPPTAPSPHAYRNTNHILLGVLLERMTGRPWELAIREQVLAPLNLEVVVDPLAPPVDNAACGHIADGPPIPPGEDYRALLTAKPWLRPAGALSGSAAQLARLGVFFLGSEAHLEPLAHARGIMSTPAGVAADHGPVPLTGGALLFTPGMFAGQRAPSDLNRESTTPAPPDVLYHRGSTPAFHADLVIFPPRSGAPSPARGGVVAILDNSGHMYGATLAAASRALSNLRD